MVQLTATDLEPSYDNKTEIGGYWYLGNWRYVSD